MIASVMMLSPGCDKIKDATSRDFKVNNIKFDFSATTQADQATRSGEVADVATRSGTTSFSVVRTVEIAELGSDDAVKYANKISNVEVAKTSISITTVPAGSFTVTNLKITAAGVSGELFVPSYSIGSAFNAPSNMNAYTEAFIKRLLDAKTVQVSVTGQSDAPAGTVINISYQSDVVLTASVL